MTTAAAAIHAPSRATQKYLKAAHVGALLHAAVLPGPVWAARSGRPGYPRSARAGRTRPAWLVVARAIRGSSRRIP